jgi:hypothetical protein
LMDFRWNDWNIEHIGKKNEQVKAILEHELEGTRESDRTIR